MKFTVYLRETSKNNHTLYILAYHNKQKKYIRTGIILVKNQLNQQGGIKDKEVKNHVELLISELDKKVRDLGLQVNYMTCEEVVCAIQKEDKKEVKAERLDFFKFSYDYVEQLKKEGKRRASDILIVLRSLQDYHSGALPFNSINKEFVLGYMNFLSTERILKRKDQFGRETVRKFKKISESTIHDRLRIIKALINKAMYFYNTEEDEFINNRVFKFIKVQPPRPKQKRAVPVDVIRKIYQYHSDTDKRGQLARDLFIASFVLCGMNAIDFYEIDRNAYHDQKLCYQRSKTKEKRFDNAEIVVCMPDLVVPILDKYLAVDSSYLYRFHEEYSHPQTFSSTLNCGLKRVAKAIGYDQNLTFYAARHSFATIARNDCRIDKTTVAECLNHSQNTITDFYLARDYTRVWDAQKIVCAYVFRSLE